MPNLLLLQDGNKNAILNGVDDANEYNESDEVGKRKSKLDRTKVAVSYPHRTVYII